MTPSFPASDPGRGESRDDRLLVSLWLRPQFWNQAKETEEDLS